jgi:CxxC motif-containing protein (DUF1111 family)
LLFAASGAEATPVDPGVRAPTGTEGGPLPNLTGGQSALFNKAKGIFSEVERLSDGLGPRFNLDSCAGCHSQPTIGGTSPATNPQVAIATAFGAGNTLPSFITSNGPIREARFKVTSSGSVDGTVHSLFVITGRNDGSLPNGTANNCNIAQDDFATQLYNGNIALRIPTPVFGMGLIETIPESALVANLAANGSSKRALGISGFFNRNPNDGRITRFGWKAQNMSGLLFAGEAYNVEMGITSELFPVERDETTGCQFSASPNSVTDTTQAAPNDALSDIERFSAFMRFLAPPAPSTTIPGGATSITHGKSLFSSVGCSQCHTPQLTTATATVAALSNQQVNLFSDLALHHMGPGLAEGITQGAAGGEDFRTAPLWGLGQRIFLLHDGRTSNLITAIQAHSSSNSSGDCSEADVVIGNYSKLSPSDQQDLLNFLRSL